MPQAQAPKQDTKQKEVIFFSTSRCHMISYKPEEFWPNGKVKTPAKMIEFDDYAYRTDDPKIIAHIMDQASFKNNPPKVRIVTEEQLEKLRHARQPEVVEARSTQKPVDYLAIAEANGPITADEE
jgi:hypothetical protein